MAITVAFMTDDPNEAADLLAYVNGKMRNGGAGTRESGHQRAAEPSSASTGSGWGDPPSDNDADPWADSGSTGSTASTSTGSGPWAEVPAGYVERWDDTKQGKRHVEFGCDDAPDCACGHAAVKVSGKGQKGIWSQWRCALSATKSYKAKCDFQEWATRK